MSLHLILLIVPFHSKPHPAVVQAGRYEIRIELMTETGSLSLRNLREGLTVSQPV